MIGEYKLNKIYCEDSYEAIKKIPDKSIDLTFTDPPYGINMDKGTSGFGKSKNKTYNNNWDSEIPTKEMFDEILRVSKDVIIFGGNYFAHLLPQSTHWIVWDKKGHIEFENPFSDCELLWTNLELKTVKKYTNIQQGFLNDGDERIHATQKPLRLVTNILKDYSKPGYIVADFYSGSGTTAVACNDLGLDFIAFEKDAEIYKKSLQRINGINASGQTSIFTDFSKLGVRE